MDTNKILFKGFHPHPDGDYTILVDGEKRRGSWILGLPAYDTNLGNSCIGAIQSYIRPNQVVPVIPETVCDSICIHQGRYYEHDRVEVSFFITGRLLGEGYCYTCTVFAEIYKMNNIFYFKTEIEGRPFYDHIGDTEIKSIRYLGNTFEERAWKED